MRDGLCIIVVLWYYGLWGMCLGFLVLGVLAKGGGVE